MSKHTQRMLVYVLSGLLILVGCAIGAFAQTAGDPIPWFRVVTPLLGGASGIIYGHFWVR